MLSPGSFIFFLFFFLFVLFLFFWTGVIVRFPRLGQLYYYPEINTWWVIDGAMQWNGLIQMTLHRSKAPVSPKQSLKQHKASGRLPDVTWRRWWDLQAVLLPGCYDMRAVFFSLQKSPTSAVLGLQATMNRKNDRKRKKDIFLSSNHPSCHDPIYRNDGGGEICTVPGTPLFRITMRD